MAARSTGIGGWPSVAGSAGPALTDMNAQLSELETLLGSDQVDCLGLGSIKPDTYVDIVNNYMAAGIPGVH